MNGQGCPKCGNKKISEIKRFNKEQFIEKAIKIHGNKYNYSNIKYKNARTKIDIICPVHGNFKQIAQNHLSNHGCPKCESSKGEQKISNYLINRNIKFNFQYIFKDCKNKRTLPFDFYLPKYNTCIEYDGEHHFKLVLYGVVNDKNKDKAVNAYKKRKINDDIKIRYCKLNNINLIRINFKDINNVEKILTKLIV